MANIQAFIPGGPGSYLLAGTTTGNVNFNGALKCRNVLISNTGSVWAYVKDGDATVTATIAVGSKDGTGTPVPPGGQVVIGLHVGSTHLAAIVASGTAGLHLTPGEGI